MVRTSLSLNLLRLCRQGSQLGGFSLRGLDYSSPLEKAGRVAAGGEVAWRPGRCPPTPTDPRPLAASALRTPISITSSYAAPFAMMSHHEMNGSLTSPSAYAGLHNIPPQMSAAAAAAAAAYGRSPMVSFGAVRRLFGSFVGGRGLVRVRGGTKGDLRVTTRQPAAFGVACTLEIRKQFSGDPQTWMGPTPARPSDAM